MAVMFGASTLLTGCTVCDTAIPPSRVAVPPVFDPSSPADVPMTAEDLAHWWTVWHDPVLNGLIVDALKANSDLRIARAHVMEARAMVTIAQSALYPSVEGSGGVWTGKADLRSKTLDALMPNRSNGVDAHMEGVAASWEPDIFGGRSDDAAAAQFLASSVEQQLTGARMIVVAEVAGTYLEATGLQRRLIVLDGSITALEQLLRYAAGRTEAGQALPFDVAQVRERLASLRATRPTLVALIDTARRRLVVLAGRTPETAAPLSPPPAFVLPAAPNGQLPSTVLEHRPDVLAYAALMRAQVARLSSAKTDLLPRFNITFLGQDGHLQFAGIPGLGGTGGLIGLSVNLPIFTAGRIRANIAANDARLEAAAADYDKSILLALEDVENAYGLRHGLDARGLDQAAALSLARRNQNDATGLYENGNKTLQDVLNARLDAFAREDDLIQTQMGQAAASVQLYRALGGGWL
jgi:NodT family efflux transporter outer membrane factor (OMF) lipoprotein